MVNKERITITLGTPILRKIDNLVDGLKIRNRSHAIEFLVSKSLNMNRPEQAFILAGGKGIKLRPITYEIPKAMIPIKGKPILEYIIELLRKYDVRNIIISIGHLGEKIKNYFGDGSKFGVKITYSEENEPLGTAGALMPVKELLNDTFIMLNGDILVDIDLKEMYEFHKDHIGMATIALTSTNNPSSFGVAAMSGNKIVRFMEKPRIPESNLINAGVYILEPELLNFVREGQSIEKDAFPHIAKAGKLFGYPFVGQWIEIEDIKSYERAINEWQGIK